MKLQLSYLSATWSDDRFPIVALGPRRAKRFCVWYGGGYGLPKPGMARTLHKGLELANFAGKFQLAGPKEELERAIRIIRDQERSERRARREAKQGGAS
jgi:hypothetical protein